MSPPGNPAGRTRRRAFGVVAVVAASVGALILAEIGLRLAHIPFDENWTPSENAIARYDEDLGWAYQEGLSREIRFETRSRAVHFDEFGARVRSPDRVPDPGAPSILFVGGSYTMGHGLSYEDSFVGRFDDEVAARGLQVVNLGVQGYGSDQALLSIRRHLPRLRAKVVVYTFIPSHIRRTANHDRRLLYPGGRFLGTKPRFALRGNGDLVQTHRPARYEDYRHSYLVDLVRIALARRRGGPSDRDVQLTRAVIREMAALCQASGAYFVLLNWRWTEDDYDGFDDLGIPVIDTLDGAPRNWDKLRIPGDDHPNERASRRAAELLVRHLEATNHL